LLGTQPEAESASPSAHHPEPSAPAKEPPPVFAPSPSPAEIEQRASIMSAPVSREGSGGFRRTSQVTLSPQEKDAGRIAGVTEVEYARQKKILAEKIANGEYGGERR